MTHSVLLQNQYCTFAIFYLLYFFSGNSDWTTLRIWSTVSLQTMENTLRIFLVALVGFNGARNTDFSCAEIIAALSPQIPIMNNDLENALNTLFPIKSWRLNLILLFDAMGWKIALIETSLTGTSCARWTAFEVPVEVF